MCALADTGTAAPQGKPRETPGGTPRPQPGRWADLRLRVASASVLAPVALLSIWYGGPAWFLLVAVAALGLGVEWSTVCGTPPWGWPGLLVPAAALAAALAGPGWAALAVLAVASGVAAVSGAGRWVAGGVLYIGLPVLSLSVLRAGGAGRAEVLFLMAAVWASDIGAYAVGRIVGGAKLAPSISPGKTRSGAVGGLLTAAAVGTLLSLATGPGWAWRAALVAAVLSVAAQAGDLFESWVKRRFGVKDSGRLIPGHGGLLDRLDGVLAAAPAAAVLALVLHPQGASWP